MARGAAYYRQRAAMYARGAGLDPNIFVRQIGAESGFRPGARSGAGARGIAQIMPFHDVQPNVPGHQVAGQNPEVDLRWAAQHMATNLRKYGNYKDALSVYNSGRPWARGRGIGETRNYVNKILNGADPATNANPAAPAAMGNTDITGGAASRPRALANFLLAQSQVLAGGGRFDLGGMAAAMRADREATTNAVSGLDVGGQDPSDPRVRVEPTVPLKGGSSARAMRLMIQQAKKMGLHVGSNIAVTGHPETGGHTSGSDHYRFLNKNTQAAIDVSGDRAQEVAYFRWIERNRRALHLKDMFFDPMKYSYDEGKKWGATIGGHGGHVHASVF